jgi:hypothetical protein
VTMVRATAGKDARPLSEFREVRARDASRLQRKRLEEI